MKIQKTIIYFFWGVGVGSGGGGRVGGCQGGWERRIEAFVKIKKKKIFFFGGGVGSGRVQSGRGGGASGQGARVDVNREVKFLSKLKKKIEGGGGQGRVGVGGPIRGWGGGGGVVRFGVGG